MTDDTARPASTTDRLVVDLFAGPGGWSQASRVLGVREVGIEWDAAACLTRRTAGHLTVRANVATYPTAPFVGRTWGVIASPPCQAWSMAGARKGELDRLNCHRLADRMAAGDDSTDWTSWEDERSPLVCEPVRWVRDVRPEWVALEQVPPVHSLWEHIARIYRTWGYSVWTGDLTAEMFGVCQTRERRILIASLTRNLSAPQPTHRRYAKGRPNEQETDLFGDGLLPWVSMADGLRAVWPDWHPDALGYRLARGKGMLERHGERPDTPVDGPAPVITSKARTAEWMLAGAGPAAERTAGQRPRRLDEPAHTVTGADTGQWVYRNGAQEHATVRTVDEPAPTVTASMDNGDTRWYERRPATTVVGSFCPDVIAAPGYRTATSRQNAEASVRVTVAEASVIQSFPHDYPWQGSRSKQFEQVGNAIPPLLATHVLSSVTGIPFGLEVAESAA